MGWLIALAVFLGLSGKSETKRATIVKKKEAVFVDPDKSKGDPPNLSGDDAGYSTSIWPNTAAVCVNFGFLGYDVRQPGKECATTQIPAAPQIRQFQREWNELSQDPEWPTLRGSLDDDGIPGKNTLNAGEAAMMIGFPWQMLVTGWHP